MALKINYILKVLYDYSRFGEKQFLRTVLTDDQLSSINDTIEKSFTINDVYCMVGTFDGSKDLFKFQVDIFKDETKQVLINSKTYEFIPDLESSDNFIKQAYVFLKSSAEYADAIDC